MITPLTILDALILTSDSIFVLMSTLVFSPEDLRIFRAQNRSRVPRSTDSSVSHGQIRVSDRRPPGIPAVLIPRKSRPFSSPTDLRLVWTNQDTDFLDSAYISTQSVQPLTLEGKSKNSLAGVLSNDQQNSCQARRTLPSELGVQISGIYVTHQRILPVCDTRDIYVMRFLLS